VNIHHLELFYYVAKFEGITSAVRKMPYGIQQPAVSGQILQLERDLGVKLFNRRPFALTPAGEELYDYLYPFFSRLSEVEARLKGEESRHLRIAASASVLRTHLPDLLEDMRRAEPKLRLTLREVEPSEIHLMLANQQVDVAVSLLHGKMTDGLQAVELLKLPIVLLVPTKWPVKKLSDLLEDDAYGKGKVAKYPLVGLPPHEMLSKIFQEELDARSIQWEPSVEVDSLETVAEYTARGFGAGIGVSIPGVKPKTGVREVPLTGFAPLVVGALYQGSLKPLARDFLDAAKKRAKELTKKK
jgi:DNA-binding transcriptional LysR family regulator